MHACLNARPENVQEVWVPLLLTMVSTKHLLSLVHRFDSLKSAIVQEILPYVGGDGGGAVAGEAERVFHLLERRSH